ncbi:hypothetical protein P175DRAFT_0501177 [Aspergillus ochraceoroseus IBT 24754]|uniref:glycogenin glucosyltransferase n=2 Tax=Aspergillus subgen. Nidulantes TaxID=2720870 RepID=A0A0F8V3V5_9EURO|nr:uncharacterized protein P175DRAFT_0501177 [Aspergillus ochraceoroseus IBT 24754]KKK26444.1 hypothetical protein ARAM_004161 [Aspergillus rambellii]PTU20556.1 hypothetical protein P175DRAFT_0501177 [Aspergillus ochraceoroseus IBT 24754]
MVDQGSAVYCTLLLSDDYLPGAVVLAHSLRDNGTHAKLAVLYTPDTLQEATIHELQTVYDILIPVHPMTNHIPANLWLMERPDLIATFTKIELWRQTQFTRIVYIDCDVVAIRAPDELLELEAGFAAAPDVGWPDCFNSGVMALRPNLEDYYALKALAERGISFDGADQGLLNLHFRNWHRLSFTYNCTPSANYQYIPAYKHFQSTISMIHFIGSQKPWNVPRQVAPFDSPYNQLLGRWWTIYDRHYRPALTEPVQQSSRPTTPQYQTQAPDPGTSQASWFPVQPQQYHVGEQAFVPLLEPPSHQQPRQPELPPVPPTVSQPGPHPHEMVTHAVVQVSNPPEFTYTPPSTKLPTEFVQTRHYTERLPQEPFFSIVPQYVRGEENVTAYIRPQAHYTHTSYTVQDPPIQDPRVQMAPVQPSYSVHSHVHHEPAAPAFDTRQRSPTPPSQPEPEIPAAFEAPRSEWDASREPPPLNSKPEGIALEKKTYAMSEDHQLFQPPASYPEAPKNMYYEIPSTKPEPHNLTQLFPWEMNAPKPTRVFADNDQSPHSPIQPRFSPEPTRDEEPGVSRASGSTSWMSGVTSVTSESWESYSRSNAWDEVPEIQRYIQSIQQSRKGRVQVISSGPSHQKSPPSIQESGSMRVTDFPSEIERPSLPVTPTPIRRPLASRSPRGEYTTDQLPPAEGVPNQEDWNPSVRLAELQRRQSEILENPEMMFERLSKGC